jgi:hypothetical protein
MVQLTILDGRQALSKPNSGHGNSRIIMKTQRRRRDLAWLNLLISLFGDIELNKTGVACLRRRLLGVDKSRGSTS